VGFQNSYYPEYEDKVAGYISQSSHCK